MRYSTRTRWIATALAVGAIAAPAVQAADYHQPFGPGGGSSPGGPVYGIVTADATVTGGSSSSGGPAYGSLPLGVALEGGGQSSGGPAYGVPVVGISPAPATTPADGFDWADAGVGAGVGIAALLLAVAAAGVVRSRGRLAHS